MAKIVIIYMSREGQTKKIAEKITHFLTQAGHNVENLAVNNLPKQFSMSAFDAVILGCSIRYGKHLKPFRQFVKHYEQQLNSQISFFFSVNLTARKQNSSKPNNNVYVKKYLSSIAWKPHIVEVFAGALRYSIYDPFNKAMIRLIMSLTSGPTDTKTDIEFTNWKQVADYANDIHDHMLRAAAQKQS